MEEKNLQLDRLVFFCDAVVAIAITLLIFNLKIDHVTDGHLTFKNLLVPWRSFIAFTLSFLNIASFWKTHHSFFAYIKKIDEKMLWFNIGWLFFIVTLPFSTSVVSSYFSNSPAMFLYSLNTFIVTIFQNMIWDYASDHKEFLKEGTLDAFTNRRFRVYCNLDMVNAVIAVIVSFFNPTLAFILLFTKLPMIIITRIFLAKRSRKKKKRLQV